MSRSYVAKALREQIATDARHRCGYCLTSARIIGAPMEIDHIIPESLGGPNPPGEPLARVLDVQRPQGESDRRCRPAHPPRTSSDGTTAGKPGTPARSSGQDLDQLDVLVLAETGERGGDRHVNESSSRRTRFCKCHFACS